MCPTLGNKKQAWGGKIEKEKDEPVVYKCLTSADRGDEGCEEEEEEEEEDRKKNDEVKKEDNIRKNWWGAKWGVCRGREVENSPIIEADTRARLENSREWGESQRLRKNDCNWRCLVFV